MYFPQVLAILQSGSGRAFYEQKYVCLGMENHQLDEARTVSE
jgi:hypothetical protein